MTDNQLKWSWVICLIAIPFLCVHLFPGAYLPRLLSILWLDTAAPLAIGFPAVFTKQTIRIKGYSNQRVEKGISMVAKGLGVLIAVAYLCYFTIPLWLGTYNVYIRHEPLTTVEDSVSNLSSAVLAPGIYFGVTLSANPSTSYTYLFPTVYRFGNSRYKFTILTGTDIILDAQPLSASSKS